MTTEHKITVEVRAKLDWTNTPPRYRVFVDDNLLTERDFIWGPDIYIRENILVNLEPGEHQLLIDQVNTAGTISTDHVTVDGAESAFNFTTL
jgi:hypothetical protein